MIATVLRTDWNRQMNCSSVCKNITGDGAWSIVAPFDAIVFETNGECSSKKQ
jgi:hypothetical protein